MFDGWISVTEDMPMVGQDVLIYSISARGYAVAITRFDGNGVKWFNSTNGLPFPRESVSHWRRLPPAPVESGFEGEGVSGYSAYGPS